MIVWLALAALTLSALYASLTLTNLSVFRTPPRLRPDVPPQPVSVLIPARNEAGNIGAAVDAVLASRGVDLDLVVLDDGSTDATAVIVAERARRDPRLRLVDGVPLPAGWNGKQHACWRLAQEARAPIMVFLDADVRLAPNALARIVALMEKRGLDLASGFPRQITLTLAEKLTVPQILVLLLGYLPLPLARMVSSPGFSAGCGQLMAVHRPAYEAAGGHRAIRATRHDGLALPRAVRAAGGCTDIFDATPLATCRMYETWTDAWAGFSKNATEGMATPVALPVWTILLGGGHVLPFVLTPIALGLGDELALALSLWAAGLVLFARTLVAIRVRQAPFAVLLHPVGVLIALAIQWSALFDAYRGRPVVWRGRSYDLRKP